ncbi:MAG TPA: hypothetical protein VJC37_05080 [Planctomycetota bacterium]|nr:hypothetical protein [Planctomycetota bacterium]
MFDMIPVIAIALPLNPYSLILFRAIMAKTIPVIFVMSNGKTPNIKLVLANFEIGFSSISHLLLKGIVALG